MDQKNNRTFICSNKKHYINNIDAPPLNTNVFLIFSILFFTRFLYSYAYNIIAR